MEFFKQGYLHLPQLFDTDLIEKLKLDFDRQFAAKRERFYKALGEKAQHHYYANHDKNRWNMLLESDSEAMKSQYFAQAKVFSLLKEIFIGEFAMIFFSSDIAAPGSAYQSIHQDGNDFAIAMNVPLVKSSTFNGATQIWPGTHIFKADGSFSRESNELSDEDIVRISTEHPSQFLELNIGDATLRDLRLIHRGTPNNSEAYRPYLSAIFFPIEEETAPEFWAIAQAGAQFQAMKAQALADGSQELQDQSNAFGRIFMLLSKSDRVLRPIPKTVSDNFSKEALYLCRFARFEDERLNLIKRTAEKSAELLSACEEYKLQTQ